MQSCRVPGGSYCSHFRTSLQLKFNFTSVGGGLTAISSKLHCSSSSTSLQGGSDCSHFKTSLQLKFNFTSVGGGSDCSHFRTSLHLKFKMVCSDCSCQIMCSLMANYMLLSAELRTHQLLLCAWITQMDLEEILCFQKFFDFTCTLCPEPWNLCAPQSFCAKHGLATSKL